MGSVEADREEMLLHPGGVVPDQGIDVRWGDDLSSLGRQAPAPQFQGCLNEGSFCHPQTGNLDQLGVGHRRFAIEQLHQIPGDGGDATSAVPASDEDGEELLVSECFDSLG